MMMGCRKCRSLGGVLLLLFGIVFLLQNLGVWDFWGIQWYTILFLIVGMASVGSSQCTDCCAVYGESKSGMKKK